jgi:uncharacterized Zn finger protein (UPF0148 family)
MPCRACGFENVPDASSCGKCGAPLTNTVSCPACGRPPKQKFGNGCGHTLTRPADRAAPPSPLPQRGRSRSYTPKHLAEKILTSRSALEGERKQVTVLFADVKGSMDLAEQIDPEEWHKIMDRFFAILSEGFTASRAPSINTRVTASMAHHGALRCTDRPRGSRAAGLLRCVTSSTGATALCSSKLTAQMTAQ